MISTKSALVVGPFLTCGAATQVNKWCDSYLVPMVKYSAKMATILKSKVRNDKVDKGQV